MQRLCERAIPSARQIFLDRSRINHSAVLQHTAALFPEEGIFLKERNPLPRDLMLKNNLPEQTAFRNLMLDQQRSKDRGNQLPDQAGEQQPGASRKLNRHERFLGAQTDASGFQHLAFQIVLTEKFPDCLHCPCGAGAESAGRGSDHEDRMRRIPPEEFAGKFTDPVGDLLLDSVVSERRKKFLLPLGIDR